MRLRRRDGQITLPALLVFPTLFLFIYLCFETTKLSREKIRHQFALDAAAFVEATNYSDFLNRTAYVNGAFPMRIFEQAYGGVSGDGTVNNGDIIWADCGEDDPPELQKSGWGVGGCRNRPYTDVLFRNGVFPRSRSGRHKFGDEASWDIEYGGPAGEPKNSTTPDMPDTAVILTIADANAFWQHWNFATGIYKLWRQVYQLLGSVEQAQLQVLEKLTKGTNAHSFLRKSYWLNTGDAPGVGDSLARQWDLALGDFGVTPHCVRKAVYHGNQETGSNGLQTYRIVGPEYPVDLNGVSPICDRAGGGGGLFQLLTVDKRFLDAFRDVTERSGFPGLYLEADWELQAGNYFNVRFDPPVVRTTVAVGLSKPGESEPAVWPNPTPKFQVRSYP